MTTTIKVSAHCVSNKEVLVKLRNEYALLEDDVLQDGEETTYHVYDDRQILVFERVKDEQQTQG